MKAFQFLKHIFIKNSSGAVINPATEDLQKGTVSTGNSTESELSIGQTFTGVWTDTKDYSEVIVSVHATEPSATDGLVVQWSSNGVDIHGTDEFTISALSGKTFSFPCQNRYVRVVYTNNGIAQSHFDLQCLLKRYASKGSSHRLKDNLNMEDDAIVTKTLIAGFTTAGGGGIVNVKVNPSGSLQVAGDIQIKNIAGDIVNPATNETSQDVAYTLAMLLDALQFGLQTDKSKTLKVQLDPLLTHTAVVATITTLTNLANIQRQGDMQMQRITEAQMDAAYIPGVYNNLIFP